MPAIVAPASVACTPTPFLLDDHSDLLGQMVVIRDEDWDEFIEMAKGMLRPGKELIIVETDQGPYCFLTEETVDLEKMGERRVQSQAV